MAKTSQHGCAWWLVIGWWWLPIAWLVKAVAKACKLIGSAIGFGPSNLYVNGKPVPEREMRRIQAEHDRRAKEYAREQEELVEKYSKMGVAVSIVSENAVASDALEIANELCKARVRKDAVPERVELDWRPLTKGGKVPKCVLRTTTVWDRSNGDSVIVHAGYLADIEPYTAEVHIWTDGSLDSYKVRVVDGRMQVVNEEGE